MGLRFVSLLAAVLLTATVTHAADPAEKCESKKLKAAGSHAACLLRADAKALLKGEAADPTKCVDRFTTKMAKAEQKAGAGVCPTEGDTGVLDAEIAAATAEIAGQLVAPDPGCPPGYLDRTTLEVVLDHIAAYEAQDWAAFVCNLHPSAFLLNDQGVHQGPAAMLQAAQAEAAFYGQAPVIDDIAVFKAIGRVLFSLDTALLVIDDGSHSYVIKQGQIRYQTGRAAGRIVLP